MKKIVYILILVCLMATPALSQETKIVAYKVVYSSYVDALEDLVQSRIQTGWQPLGGISRYGKDLMQAMVKYEE
jgi:hypothetical protein